MTKAEQARVVAWRLKILRYSQGEPRQVARTCRHFGISGNLFYRWKRRFEAYGEAGLADRPRTPLRLPRATPPAVVSKILYLCNQRSAIQFLNEVRQRLPFRIHVVQTDNGAEFQSQFHWHAEALDIKHVLSARARHG
jgi:transposase-like protein